MEHVQESMLEAALIQCATVTLPSLQHSGRSHQDDFDSSGRTPWGCLAAAGNWDAWDEAVEEQREDQLNPPPPHLVHQPDTFQETPLHLAASHGRVDMVKMLVKDLKDLALEGVDAENWEGWTPLAHALVNGHIEVAKVLLKYGAKAEHVTSRGDTVLHLAAWCGSEKSVEWLLKHGMPAYSRNNYGCRPIDMAPPGAVRHMLHAAPGPPPAQKR